MTSTSRFVPPDRSGQAHVQRHKPCVIPALRPGCRSRIRRFDQRTTRRRDVAPGTQSVRPIIRSAIRLARLIVVRILIRQNIEGPSRRNLKDRRHGEVSQELCRHLLSASATEKLRYR